MTIRSCCSVAGMGACQCKCCLSHDEDRSNLSAYDAPSSSLSNSVLGINNSPLNRDRCISGSKKRSCTPKSVDSLILQTVNMIGKLGLVGYVSRSSYSRIGIAIYAYSLPFRYNHEPPGPLQKLHIIGDQEDGWLQIIISMINIVPVDNPLGPAVITVVLDDCPLPNKVRTPKSLVVYGAIKMIPFLLRILFEILIEPC